MRMEDDSRCLEKVQPLIIIVAPYGPTCLPGDVTKIPITCDELSIRRERDDTTSWRKSSWHNGY
jgi:hypothetical protein